MNNEIMLNDILHLTESELSNSKIELNMTKGNGGLPFIDEWLTESTENKISGDVGCCYWSWYGKSKNFTVGQYVFSFLRLSSEDWLFVSAAEILEITANVWRAKYKILNKFSSLFGRLVIRYKKGNTYARYTFNMDYLIDKCYVKEVLTSQYSGEQFEGYDKVNLPFRKLDDILHGRIMPTYCEALKRITGIYCLTDTKTGKLYIGSASGELGVAQRWGNYLDTKHGGNKKLIALYKEKGEKYFEDNFTFTILEYFGLSYDTERIIEREQYWKKCFSTIKNGYNDN